MKALVKDSKDYHTKIFHGAGNDYEMICHQDKIVIPQTIQQKIMEWYHTTLLYPGRDRTYTTISQHFYWKGMKKEVEQYVKRCPTCQQTKKTYKKYGLLPVKEAEAVP